MSRTESTMLPLGTAAPAFILKDVTTGLEVSPALSAGEKGLLVVFASPHCPYVKHVQGEIGRLGEEYVKRGVKIVAISSNDADAYPDDAPDKLREFAEAMGLTFPVLYDEDQSAAQAYRAACTPDFFLFDPGLRLVYRGQLDGSRPQTDIPVTGSDLRAALEAVLSGEQIVSAQKPSLGCNIKWKPGNEPDYFAVG